jgi:hypothetical protein
MYESSLLYSLYQFFSQTHEFCSIFIADEYKYLFLLYVVVIINIMSIKLVLVWRKFSPLFEENLLFLFLLRLTSPGS